MPESKNQRRQLVFEIQSSFLFLSTCCLPTSVGISPPVSKSSARWLVLGLGTRFFAACAVDSDLGGDFRGTCRTWLHDQRRRLETAIDLSGMLLPLILSGPGKLSLDHVLRQR
jgi:hypothetical protein